MMARQREREIHNLRARHLHAHAVKYQRHASCCELLITCSELLAAGCTCQLYMSKKFELNVSSMLR